MKYSRFEQLPVWRDAIEVAVGVYALTANGDFRGQRSLSDQIERAAVSISNNIAEGFERGTTKELLMFLYIARGSAGEVRSMFCLLDRLPLFLDLKSEISNLKYQVEGVSRQIRGWTNSLQNSEIKGQRYLNDKTKQRAQQAKDREEFMEGLRRAQTENIRRFQIRNES